MKAAAASFILVEPLAPLVVELSRDSRRYEERARIRSTSSVSSVAGAGAAWKTWRRRSAFQNSVPAAASSKAERVKRLK